jgi:hypothetical protein
VVPAPLLNRSSSLVLDDSSSDDDADFSSARQSKLEATLAAAARLASQRSDRASFGHPGPVSTAVTVPRLDGTAQSGSKGSAPLYPRQDAALTSFFVEREKPVFVASRQTPPDIPHERSDIIDAAQECRWADHA